MSSFILFGPEQVINVKQVAVFREPVSSPTRLSGLLECVSADGYIVGSAYSENYVKSFEDLVERLHFVLGQDAVITLPDLRMVIVKEYILHMYSRVDKQGSVCHVQLQSGLGYDVSSYTVNEMKSLLQVMT